MKPHNPKSEVKQNPCEVATPGERLDFARKVPSRDAGKRPCHTECLGGMAVEGPRELWERQLPLSLQPNAAAPITARFSGKHPDMFSAPTKSFLTLLLAPLSTL